MKSPKRLQGVGRYLKDTGYGWWIFVAAPFGFWDQIVRFLPKSWEDKMPSWAPETIAVVALLVVPFIAWQKQWTRFRRMEAKWHKAFGKSKIEAFLGENARMSQQDRFNQLGALFDARKKEIEEGDFSRAAEIIPIVEAYVPMLARWVPQGSVAYAIAEAEIKEVYKKVEEHLEALDKD